LPQRKSEAPSITSLVVIIGHANGALHHRIIAMSFDTQGFFSPEMSQYRAAIRSAPECEPWFEFSFDLNRLGLELLSDHETPLEDSRLLAISGFFARGHQTFQAAILLIEHGMIGDARAVVRTGVEGAIALHALAADADFVDRLVAAHRAQQRKVLNIILSDSGYRSICSADQIAQMEAVLSENASLKNLPETAPRPINWAEEAQKYCKDLYDGLYRFLSDDGVHANLTALQRHFEVRGQNITQLIAGPNPTGSPPISFPSDVLTPRICV
jgi:hypothetical protein